jgi:hypothetical protein
MDDPFSFRISIFSKLIESSFDLLNDEEYADKVNNYLSSITSKKDFNKLQSFSGDLKLINGKFNFSF